MKETYWEEKSKAVLEIGLSQQIFFQFSGCSHENSGTCLPGFRNGDTFFKKITSQHLFSPVKLFLNCSMGRQVLYFRKCDNPPAPNSKTQKSSTNEQILSARKLQQFYNIEKT